MRERPTAAATIMAAMRSARDGDVNSRMPARAKAPTVWPLGNDVAEARAILTHTNRQVAEAWSKLLESAVANAAENHSIDDEDLRIVFITADEGPTLKRFRPRAMGRATKIRKRTSHLSIGLEPKE